MLKSGDVRKTGPKENLETIGQVVALGFEPSEEIRRWYAAISCCIQRSNAKILRGEPVPGRPTPSPSRFAVMGRDLGFAA